MNKLYISLIFLLLLIIFVLIISSYKKEGYQNQSQSQTQGQPNSNSVITSNTTSPSLAALDASLNYLITEYDNYNHYSQSAVPTMFYGPSGSTATIMTTSGNYEIVVNIPNNSNNTSGKTYVFTLSNNAVYNSNNMNANSNSTTTDVSSNVTVTTNNNISDVSTIVNQTFKSSNGYSLVVVNQNGTYIINMTTPSGVTTFTPYQINQNTVGSTGMSGSNQGTQLSLSTTYYGPNNQNGTLENNNGIYSIVIMSQSSTRTYVLQDTNTYTINSLFELVNKPFVCSSDGSTAKIVFMNNIYVIEITDTQGNQTILIPSNDFQNNTYKFGIPGNPYQSYNTNTHTNVNNDYNENAGYSDTSGNCSGGINYNYSSLYSQGIPKSQIPSGQQDMYILKSELIPPVCPACPTCPTCPSNTSSQNNMNNNNNMNNSNMNNNNMNNSNTNNNNNMSSSNFNNRNNYNKNNNSGYGNYSSKNNSSGYGNYGNHNNSSGYNKHGNNGYNNHGSYGNNKNSSNSNTGSYNKNASNFYSSPYLIQPKPNSNNSPSDYSSDYSSSSSNTNSENIPQPVLNDFTTFGM
jgi:hypothetical protein